MSEPRPTPPRFDPGARALGQLIERRGRLLVLAAGALLLALGASSVANNGRMSLRCVDGQLVAFRGVLMPAGEEPLDDPTLPPLPVPAAACEDEELESLDTLRARHRELAHGRMDEAMLSEDRMAMESTMEALDAMAETPESASDAERERKRKVLESVVDAKVEEARASQQEALRWIERAQRAGVDPARLRAAERMLWLLAPEPTAPPPPAEEMPEPSSPALETPAPRSL